MHSFSHWQPFFYLFIYFRNPLHGFTVLNFLRIRRDTLNEYATVVSPTCRSSHSKYPPFLVAWVLFTRLRTKIVIYHCRALSRYIKNALSVKRLAKISTLLPHKTYNWTRLSVVKIAALNTKEQSDGNWSSFQLAKSTPPQSVIDRAIAPSARMPAEKVRCTSYLLHRLHIRFVLQRVQRVKTEHRLRVECNEI